MSRSVSVIVPVYNAQTFLAQCLDSLLAQTLRDMEIILVDDASTDVSADIARNYVARYPDRVRLLSLPRNGGQGAARNAGLDAATGEYVGFADADDTVEPDMFRALYTAARDANAQVAVCGIRRVYDGAGASEKLLLPEGITGARDLLGNSEQLSPLWNKIYLRTVILENKIGFPEIRMGEDMVFVFKVMTCTVKLACINKVLYNWQIHATSTSLDMLKRRDVIIAISALKNWLKERNLLDSYSKEYRAVLFRHLFYYPACHLLIDALFKGRHRWRTLLQSPRYLYSLCKFLSGQRVA